VHFRLLYRLHAALVCALLATPVAASAADGEDTKLDLGSGDPGVGGPVTSTGGGGGGTLVRTIVGLVVVIGVIYGLAWILRQVKGARGADGAGSGLESLATLPLAGDRTLHLVRAGDEVILVGVGANGVTPVRTYSLQEARDAGLPLGDDDGGARGPGIAADQARLLDRIRDRTTLR
jgi:flagellar protein FliO/FliZ